MLAGIATFEFALFGQQFVRSLFYLRGSNKKIQGRSLDLLHVVEQLEVAREDLTFRQNNGAKEYFSRCFEYCIVAQWKWPP